MGTCSGLMDEVENGIAVVAPISDDIAAWRQIAQERWNRGLIVGLPGGESDSDGQTVTVHHGVDFGAQSSTRQTDGVIRTPFLPPAAC